MKKKSQILAQYFVSQTEIQRLLNIPYAKAKMIYQTLDKKERQSEFRVYENKVPLKDVLQMAHVNLQFLIKQIESEEKRTT